MPLKRRLEVRKRPPSARQQMLPFHERSARRQRVFKRVILGATLVVLASMIGVSQSARYRLLDFRAPGGFLVEVLHQSRTEH